MSIIANKITDTTNDMTYSIPSSTGEQLLLLPRDSTCFTADTISISSALSFDTNNQYNSDSEQYLFEFTPETGIPKHEEVMGSDQQSIYNRYTNESMI